MTGFVNQPNVRVHKHVFLILHTHLPRIVRLNPKARRMQRSNNNKYLTDDDLLACVNVRPTHIETTSQSQPNRIKHTYTQNMDQNDTDDYFLTQTI